MSKKYFKTLITVFSVIATIILMFSVAPQLISAKSDELPFIGVLILVTMPFIQFGIIHKTWFKGKN